MKPEEPRRRMPPWAPFALVLLVMGPALWWAWPRAERDLGAVAIEQRWPPPLDELGPCELSTNDAAAWARERERKAEAHWERAPFSAAELPEAVLAMGQAERCFAAAGDLEGRVRAEGRRRLFEQELARHVQRTRLALALAQRDGKAEDVARHAATLLDLLARSGEAGKDVREGLARLLRTARALSAESKKGF